MWVGNAVSHCLRELDILHEDTYPAKSNILPSNLFTCKSLVTLKLEGDILLDVPRMASLPSLKTLKLLGVTYLKDGTLQRLISNCTILEDLVVDLRDNDSMGKLTVLDAYLQSLSLYIPYDHGIDELVIDTPSLKYLKLRLHSFNDHYCLIENMPNMIEAYLDVELLDINSLIGSITSVKRLAIFSEVITFHICLCTLLFSNQLVRLLEASSNLQGLEIFFMDHHVPLGMDEWNQPSTVPECMLSSLQSLNWLMYTGKPQERDIVVYILKHAIHLKTTTIKSPESAVPKFEMLKELVLSSRASPTCQFMFD
ncbi:hypothetical protein Bca52824_000731 [Brassica carinata]|uniref:FBD domain-containing protein n=1 Tax=Brassica carinata TaxID=52824 RepID=A0A8X7WG50_BRACI|nr:hypothetical protein Bca52824_000731 [Brassica carinata]